MVHLKNYTQDYSAWSSNYSHLEIKQQNVSLFLKKEEFLSWIFNSIFINENHDDLISKLVCPIALYVFLYALLDFYLYKFFPQCINLWFSDQIYLVIFHLSVMPNCVLFLCSIILIFRGLSVFINVRPIHI